MDRVTQDADRRERVALLPVAEPPRESRAFRRDLDPELERAAHEVECRAPWAGERRGKNACHGDERQEHYGSDP